jgi:acyl-homoserine-lactone acylase
MKLETTAAGLILAIGTGLAAAQQANQPSRPAGEILWDTYGVPHIYGPDILSVVRGYGYAQMEAQAELMLRKTAIARGRAAEYFGAGTENANAASDIQIRTYGIPDRARRWLQTGGERQRQILQSFMDGANEYADRNPSDIDPSFRQVLPLQPTDALALFQLTIHFNFMPEQSGVPGLLAAWQQGQAAHPAASGTGTSGSNGWALAPAKSADQNPILMGNPHLPWGINQPIPNLEIYQWMEAELVVGDVSRPSLNATGVTFPGSPFIGIGFSDDIGWTHTNNTIKNADLYELQLTSDGTGYRFGGTVRPLSVRQDQIKVRQTDGSLTTQSFTIASSVHGPIIARRADNRALALRVAGLNTHSVVTQYWDMISAHDLAEFAHANSALQMPFFNVIFADRQGEIMYLFGGRQPVRNGGTFSNYAGILDGSDPSTLWTHTLDWGALPKAIDPPGGFVQNSNDPPWTTTFPRTLQPSDYPAWIAPVLMTLRPQHGASFLLSQDRFTMDEILAGKESTEMRLADRILPDLLAAADASGDTTAKQAADILRAWDRTADAPSAGGSLFERWYEIYLANPATPRSPVFGSAYPAFRVEWSLDQPLTTPVGLADAAGAVPSLVMATHLLGSQFGTPAVTWGDVHRITLVTHDSTLQTATPITDAPQSGTTDVFGPIRVIDSFPSPDRKHRLGYFGDGWVQLVEFTSSGARSEVLLTYGNASRPGSPHIADQLPRFENKTLRPAWRDRGTVEQNTVKREPF